MKTKAIGIFGVSLIIFGAIMLVRVNLIFQHRLESLIVTQSKAQSVIDQNGLGDWKKYVNRHDSYPSYNKMMFQLNKWTYKDFYGDLEKWDGIEK